MRALMKFCILGLVLASQAQNVEEAEVFKLDGINVFVKAQPVGNYGVLEEINVSGALKSSKTQSQMIGAAGFNKLKYAIGEMNAMNQKAQKKGNDQPFDGVIMIKPNKVQIIKLLPNEQGTTGIKGALAFAEREKKTGKLVFYASRPETDYEVVAPITYNQGGLGETMRGVSSMDVAINGMLDKGIRWVKKGKISSDFDALIVDWRMLRLGKVRGELIKFK